MDAFRDALRVRIAEIEEACRCKPAETLSRFTLGTLPARHISSVPPTRLFTNPGPVSDGPVVTVTGECGHATAQIQPFEYRESTRP